MKYLRAIRLVRRAMAAMLLIVLRNACGGDGDSDGGARTAGRDVVLQVNALAIAPRTMLLAMPARAERRLGCGAVLIFGQTIDVSAETLKLGNLLERNPFSLPEAKRILADNLPAAEAMLRTSN